MVFVVQLGLSAWHIGGLWASLWIIIERILTFPFFFFFFCIYRLMRRWGVVIRHVHGYSSVGDSLLFSRLVGKRCGSRKFYLFLSQRGVYRSHTKTSCSLRSGTDAFTEKWICTVCSPNPVFPSQYYPVSAYFNSK